MKKYLFLIVIMLTSLGCGIKSYSDLHTPVSYDSLKAKRVDHYIQVLKDFKIYEGVVERLKRKTTLPPDELIAQLFDGNDVGFCSYLFSDFYYDLDGFYESFDYNIQTALEAGFNDQLKSFQIIWVYYDRGTKEYLGEIVSRFEEGGLSPEDFENAKEWSSRSDPIFKIQANVRNEVFEYEWTDWEHGSRFLKSMNDFNESNNIEGRWFPLPSEYSEYYIFTTEAKYDLIRDRFLIVPEGYESDNMEYPVGYARML